MKRWKITGKRTPTATKEQAKLELHLILRWNTRPQAFTGTTKKMSRIHIKERHHVTLLWCSCCRTWSSGSLWVGSMGCHCPQGETEKQAGCFLETSPNYHGKACKARRDKHGAAVLWFWPPVLVSNHLLLIVGCSCKSLVDWLEYCSKPLPMACLSTHREQPLGTGSCSLCWRACSLKSFLAYFSIKSSGYHFFFSCALSICLQTVRFV